MEKRKGYIKVGMFLISVCCGLFLLGCGTPTGEVQDIEKEITNEISNQLAAMEETSSEMSQTEYQEPMIREVNWSNYFGELNGAAVVYNPEKNEYRMYRPDEAEVRRSPCSTFKIISGLIGLEEGVIKKEDSLRKWSGEIFWRDTWNQDLDFKGAFQSSCVWYFREVIDDLGQERMLNALNTLSYGNMDVSDWQGKQNTNNSNPVLTGFWIESSLKISPKEQVEVLNKIFGEESAYSAENVEYLKQVMRQEDIGESLPPVYGKTGTGNKDGVTIDAWFTGFVEGDAGMEYFCVYLGKTQGEEISGVKAREVALNIIEGENL